MDANRSVVGFIRLALTSFDVVFPILRFFCQVLVIGVLRVMFTQTIYFIYVCVGVSRVILCLVHQLVNMFDGMR